MFDNVHFKMTPKSLASLAVAFTFAGLFAAPLPSPFNFVALAQSPAPTPLSPAETWVDTALMVSVDVSSSVDETRYRLQMEGIAQALEDASVIDAILNGPQGAILFSLMTWADRPDILLPWVRIASREDARGLAARLRKMPRQTGEFTCMSKMLRSVNDKVVPQIPARANRIVIDVSGDGPDNCNAAETTDVVRDELVASNVIVNGLPILDIPAAAGASPARASLDIEQWYTDHVKGGLGSFVLAANGYEDFGRAIRQKFVIEISGLTPPELPRPPQQSDVASVVQQSTARQ